MVGNAVFGRSRAARAVAFLIAVAVALVWGGMAHAQESSDDQYGGAVAPSGPLVGFLVQVLNDALPAGVVGPGDVLIIPGDFNVADGASITLQDSDGTQGTLIDGQNANITEGSVRIEVTGSPVINAAGENGELNTDGLFVVATTGISLAGGGAVAGDGAAAEGGAVASDGAAAGNGAAAEGEAAAGDGAAAEGEAGSDGVAASILPDTGGTATVALLAGGLLAAGGGLVLLRRQAANRQ